MNRRIIFDVGHPAQVHNFKHIYWDLNKKGWTGLFTAKDKEVTLDLLKNYNLPYVIIGKSGANLIAKILVLFTNFFRFVRILHKFKPGIVICRFSPHAIWGSFIMGIPVIGLADSEHTKFLDSITVPFARAKITGKSYEKTLGKNHIRFEGNIELFYLHPNRYKIPGKKHYALNLADDQEYVLFRFVAWNAHHDVGEKGITSTDKLRIVKMLDKRYKVFISSENELPCEFEKYKIKIPPERMHDVIAHASIYIGEGASMASEAACLGVPGVYINSLDAGSLKEETRYGLLYNLRDSENLLDVVKMLIADSRLKQKSKDNLVLFMKGKIDATSFLVWFIENWPGSLKKIKEDPDYQLRFK